MTRRLGITTRPAFGRTTAVKFLCFVGQSIITSYHTKLHNARKLIRLFVNPLFFLVHKKRNQFYRLFSSKNTSWALPSPTSHSHLRLRAVGRSVPAIHGGLCPVPVCTTAPLFGSTGNLFGELSLFGADRLSTGRSYGGHWTNQGDSYIVSSPMWLIHRNGNNLGLIFVSVIQKYSWAPPDTVAFCGRRYFPSITSFNGLHHHHILLFFGAPPIEKEEPSKDFFKVSDKN